MFSLRARKHVLLTDITTHCLAGFSLPGAQNAVWVLRSWQTCQQWAAGACCVHGALRKARFLRDHEHLELRALRPGHVWLSRALPGSFRSIVRVHPSLLPPTNTLHHLRRRLCLPAAGADSSGKPTAVKLIIQQTQRHFKRVHEVHEVHEAIQSIT
jgi:hypothetical protein